MFKRLKPVTKVREAKPILLYVVGILALYSAVLLTFNLVRGNGTKVAYVNSASLLQKYKGAVEANQRLEAEGQKWEENIHTLQAELDSLNFLFANKGNEWSVAKKKDLATYARKKEQDLNRYSQAIQQKAASRQQELLTPVLSEINNAVADYAKENDFAIVLGTIDGNIVYANTAVDITDAVLQNLNR